MTAPLPARVSTGKTAWLSVVFVSALVFWLAIAFPYLIGTADQIGLYETERLWIILHVALGTMALLTGPVQLWLGFARRNMALHRNMGKVYIAAVGLNAVVALRLAATADRGPGLRARPLGARRGLAADDRHGVHRHSPASD